MMDKVKRYKEILKRNKVSILKSGLLFIGVLLISGYITGWFAVYLGNVFLGTKYYTDVWKRLIIGIGIEWISMGGLRLNFGDEER